MNSPSRAPPACAPPRPARPKQAHPRPRTRARARAGQPRIQPWQREQSVNRWLASPRHLLSRACDAMATPVWLAAARGPAPPGVGVHAGPQRAAPQRPASVDRIGQKCRQKAAVKTSKTVKKTASGLDWLLQRGRDW